MLSHILFVLVSIASLTVTQTIDPSTIPQATRGKNPLQTTKTTTLTLMEPRVQTNGASSKRHPAL